MGEGRRGEEFLAVDETRKAISGSLCLSVCLSIYLSIYLYIKSKLEKDNLWYVWIIKQRDSTNKRS